MALPKIVDHVRVVGDHDTGIKHKGRAHTLLALCRKLSRGLPQYVLREPQGDGCEIIAEKRDSFSVATIVVPTVEKTKRKEEEPILAGTLVLVAGSETVGYHVAQISFDGELIRELEFERASDLFLAVPRSATAKPIYATKAVLDAEDPSVIGLNTLSEASWDVLCEIEDPDFTPGAASSKCFEITPTVREVEGEPRQAGVYRFQRRQCRNAFEDPTVYALDRREYTQLTENAGLKPSIGPALFVPLDGSDPSAFYHNTLSITGITYWADSLADALDNDWAVYAVDQIFFQMLIAPSGLMKLDPGYLSTDVGDYLYGDYTFQDTGESWFMPWEDELLGLFVRQDLRTSIYAWNRVVPGFEYSTLNTPLRAGYLENGAPDFGKEAPAHELFFAAKYLNVSVQVSALSFMEGTFKKRWLEGVYPHVFVYDLEESRHRTLTSAATLYGSESLSEATERSERVRLAVETFFFSVREKQQAAGVKINENMSLAGNLYAYISDGTPGETDYAIDVFNEINNIRLLHDLPVLTLDVDLEFAAHMHAVDSARNNLESHTGSDGSSPTQRMQRTSYNRRFSLICEVGENVAFGQTWGHEAVLAWTSSPPHWANIINPDWTDTGIAVWPNAEGRLYWVQVFGRRDI